MELAGARYRIVRLLGIGDGPARDLGAYAARLAHALQHVQHVVGIGHEAASGRIKFAAIPQEGRHIRSVLLLTGVVLRGHALVGRLLQQHVRLLDCRVRPHPVDVREFTRVQQRLGLRRVLQHDRAERGLLVFLLGGIDVCGL